jgi:uncharacterized protein
MKMGPLCKASWLLMVIGSINWGLIAIDPTWNVVNMLLNSVPVVETIVYGLVGLSGVYALVGMFKCKGCK